MCLTLKEPILALKLANDNVSIINVGLIFSLDTITYSITSFGLNFVKEEANGKKYGRLQYIGCLVFVISMLLTGPAPLIDKAAIALHRRNDLFTLCIGVSIGGIGGALINNNSTPAMILTEHEESEKNLGRPLTTREKNKLRSSVSAINTGSFGVGSILGPILASLLDAYFGF